jgi:hypothetical protein
MNIQPEHSLGVDTLPVPTGWTKVYTRDNEVQLVPSDKLDDALRRGLLEHPFDLDSALADWEGAMKDALDGVPKALAESRATGFERDEDAWIINDCMTKVRDSFAALIFTAGAVLPTEADVHAVREYLEDAPKREANRVELQRKLDAGEPITEGDEKNANPAAHFEAMAEKHADALAKVDEARYQARLAKVASDKADRESAVVDALAGRTRSLQLAGHPVELVNGVLHRKDETGVLRPADPRTGQILPPPAPEPAEPAAPVEPAPPVLPEEPTTEGA